VRALELSIKFPQRAGACNSTLAREPSLLAKDSVILNADGLGGVHGYILHSVIIPRIQVYNRSGLDDPKLESYH